MLRQQLQKYQHQQRLLFSTARKRRRKPKLPSTTRDRLRRVTSPNNNNNNHQQFLKKIDGDLVTERMQTRLDWVRSNIESLWKDPNVTTRPDRYEVVMDGNWWKWNILLALTPGILIATYCELVAKPEMKEKRKDGLNSGLPEPSSNSFLEDLYDGFMHYLYGMEPVESKQIQPEGAIVNTGSGSKSRPHESDYQQLQELKDQIKELEERMVSQRPRPGIRERHDQMRSPRPETTTSTSNGDSSIPTNAKWILETLTESLDFAQEAAMSVLFPSPGETQENETSKDSAIVSSSDAVGNAEASDVQDGSKTTSSFSSVETKDSSSPMGSTASKEKEKDSTTLEESKNHRRWWQLWK